MRSCRSINFKIFTCILVVFQGAKMAVKVMAINPLLFDLSIWLHELSFNKLFKIFDCFY